MTITCWKDHQVGVNCYSNYSWSPIGFFWFEEIYSTPNSQKPITLTRLQSFRSWIKTERSIKSILFSPIMLGCSGLRLYFTNRDAWWSRNRCLCLPQQDYRNVIVIGSVNCQVTDCYLVSIIIVIIIITLSLDISTSNWPS